MPASITPVRNSCAMRTGISNSAEVAAYQRRVRELAEQRKALKTK